MSLPGSILRPEVTWRWSPCCRMMWLLLLLLLLLIMAVFHSADDDYLQTDRYHVNLSHHNRSTTAACVQNINCTLNTSCNFTALQIHADYLTFLGSSRRYRWMLDTEERQELVLVFVQISQRNIFLSPLLYRASIQHAFKDIISRQKRRKVKCKI